MSDAHIISSADAAYAANALFNLTNVPPLFMPPQIIHWELHQDEDGVHINGQLPDGTPNARSIMEKVAKYAPKGRLDDSKADRILSVHFDWDDVPVCFWWMPPIRRWIVPERCATCPTELGAPGVPFVRIGEGRDAPVICIPCRDLMHQQWIVAANQIAEGN